ncbi:MAG: tetratricopeptide repeat protein [Pseudomonadota bacterium]|nr:tetratricopeptide repeat protein [Pseudomonadota bacterium]
MKAGFTLRATLLAVAIAVGLAGCSDNQEEMSQEEIEYLSHLDQSRFFQRQGELKASTLEARSAIELQPQRIDPYLIIVTNLLTAGDAPNAERQLDKLVEKIGLQNLNHSQKNEVALIRAKANLEQHQFDEVTAALDEVQSPDQPQALRALLLRADNELEQGNVNKAELLFSQAASEHTRSVQPHLGLAKIALVRGNDKAVDKHLKSASDIDPDNEDVWLWKARVAQSRGNWQQAEDAYINALESIGQYDLMTRQKYETMSALIQVLREQNKSSEAFVYEEILAKSTPGTIKSNLTAAQEAYSQGDLASAARYLEEVLAQAPGHKQSALMLGIVRFRQGRTEEAQALLEPIAGSMEDNEQVQKLLAATRLRLNDPQGARELLDNLQDKESDPQTLAMVGIASLASGETESGQKLIEEALALAPDNHQLRLRYASWLARTGQTDAAIKQARTVMAKAPDEDQARVVIIEAYQRAGDLAAATESASAWVKEQPDNVTALLLRGELALRNNNPGEARSYFRQADRKAPQNPAPQVALGTVERLAGNQQKSRQHFREAVLRAPDNRNALQGIASVMDREALADFMQEVQKQHPDSFGPRLVLLENALIKGDTKTADQLTAGLLEREQENQPAPAEPLVAAVYQGIGAQLAERNQAQQAAQVLERGRVLFPDNQAIGLRAAALAFTQNNTGKARRILRELKTAHPDSAAPYRLEGQYLETEGEYRGAAEMYELAYGKEPSARLAVARAQALNQTGQTETAIQVLQTTGEQFPTDERLSLTLAMLQQNAGQTDAARATYERLVEQHPNNTVALNNLAWLYYEQGDDRAVNLARRAHELNPENGAVADTYGWILFESGQQGESVPILEKAHELDPESREIAMHLAEAYRAAGRNRDARRLLEKFQGNG